MRWLVGLGLLSLLGCGGFIGAERKPDILVVVLDTVRADRLSAYGHEQVTDEFLSTLARESGVLFEDGTAPTQWLTI